MTTPRTKAGKRLMRAIEAWDLGERPEHEKQGIELILAIEAEAAPLDIAQHHHQWHGGGDCGCTYAETMAAPAPLDGLDEEGSLAYSALGEAIRMATTLGVERVPLQMPLARYLFAMFTARGDAQASLARLDAALREGETT